MEIVTGLIIAFVMIVVALSLKELFYYLWVLLCERIEFYFSYKGRNNHRIKLSLPKIKFKDRRM